MKTSNQPAVDLVTAQAVEPTTAPATLPEPQQGGSYLRNPVTGELTEQRPAEEA